MNAFETAALVECGFVFNREDWGVMEAAFAGAHAGKTIAKAIRSYSVV